MPPLTVVYCTDEDICVRCGGDFGTLVPADQVIARGTDGVFMAGSPWILTSATVDFEAWGVLPGMVIQLTKPVASFPGSGDRLAIHAVAGNTITLRRVGQTASGIGQPPVPLTGLTGVAFSIATFGPQIEDVSYDINRRFNIDANYPDRATSYLYDLRELRQLCVLEVLHRQYLTEARGKEGEFVRKEAQFKAETDELLERVNVRWGSLGNAAQPTNRFTGRIVR